MFTITPLHVATGPQREKSRFTYMHNFGDKVDIPYIAWLIEGEGLTALVDAGCSADDYARWVRPESGGPLMLGGERFADVVDATPIEDLLAARDMAFDDIDLLIQTHADWDHCMNTRKFRRTRVVIQRQEWNSVPAHPLFMSTYARPEVYAEIAGNNLELLDGDTRIAPGLELVVTPGHSPAGQSVLVDTAAGRYAIAGMCTIRENFFPPEEVLAKGTYVVIPPGMHIDPIQCYDSMLRLKELAGDNVLPFHDAANPGLGTIG